MVQLENMVIYTHNRNKKRAMEFYLIGYDNFK